MIYLTADKIQFDLTGTIQFVTRRLLRIVPPYWAMLSIILITIFVGKEFGLFRTNEIRLWQTISHFFYLQDIVGCAPLDVAFWTLCIEVQFYLFFATLMFFAHRLGREAIFWLLAVSIMICMIVQCFNEVPNCFFLKHWPVFSLGCLLRMAKTEGDRLGIFSLCLVCLVWSAMNSPFEFAFLSLVGLLVFSPVRSVPLPLLFLGKISFSLYLVHGLVGSLLAGIMKNLRLTSEFQTLGIVCLFILVAIAVATAFSSLIERPAIDLSHWVVAKRKPY